MTTSVEEFTRLREALIIQQQPPETQEAEEAETQDAEEAETQDAEEAETQETQEADEAETQEERCARCERPRDGEQNFFEECGCFVCGDCEMNLFFENRMEDEDEVSIRCPHCGESNTYDHDYFN